MVSMVSGQEAVSTADVPIEAAQRAVKAGGIDSGPGDYGNYLVDNCTSLSGIAYPGSPDYKAIIEAAKMLISKEEVGEM